jgi:hypothetical protein
MERWVKKQILSLFWSFSSVLTFAENSKMSSSPKAGTPVSTVEDAVDREPKFIELSSSNQGPKATPSSPAIISKPSKEHVWMDYKRN